MTHTKMKNDTHKFNKGRKVAEEISSVMLSGTMSSNNLDETKEWVETNKFADRVVDCFSDEEKFAEAMSRFSANDKKKDIDRLRQSMNQTKIRKRRNLILTLSSSIAAVLVGVALLLMNSDHDDVVVAELTNVIEKSSEEKPKLITMNGEEIDLSSTNKQIVIDGESIQTVNDTLKYNSVSAENNTNEVVYNQLVLPAKYTYSLVLSDGSKVHLNANSELRYPVKFVGENREVFLKGEAFFEVSKDKSKPFIVTTSTARVKVYGTRFNVNSYDAANVKTALVSGSVGVSLIENTQFKEVMIKPEYMVTLNTSNGKYTTNKINTEKYNSWLKGFFRCDMEEISILLSDIATWYGVAFTYEFEESKNIKVSASINRNTPIEEVISLLEATSSVKFTKKREKNYVVR